MTEFKCLKAVFTSNFFRIESRALNNLLCIIQKPMKVRRRHYVNFRKS